MSSEASCGWSGLAIHLGFVEKSLRARGNGRGVTRQVKVVVVPITAPGALAVKALVDRLM